jgi:hypothetical protein
VHRVQSVEVELELEGSAPEGVAAREVELLAAVAEGVAAPLLGLRVKRVLTLVVLLPHLCTIRVNLPLDERQNKSEVSGSV